MLSRKSHICLIVATYNCADTIERCISSFEAQTYKEKSLVIVDGASTDGTIDIIRRYKHSVSLFISEKDNSIYEAWNKAIKRLPDQVEWVQFMGADDYYASNTVLESIASRLSELPRDRLLAHAPVKVVYPSGAVRVFGKVFDRDTFFRTGNMHEAATVQVGFFHKKELFERYGLYDENLKIFGDLDFFLRCLKTEDSLFIPNTIATVHEIGGLSTSPAYAYTAFREREFVLARHGLWQKRNKAYFMRLIANYTKQRLFELLGEKATFKIVNLVRSFTSGLPMHVDEELERRDSHG